MVNVKQMSQGKVGEFTEPHSQPFVILSGNGVSFILIAFIFGYYNIITLFLPSLFSLHIAILVLIQIHVLLLHQLLLCADIFVYIRVYS